MPKEYDAYKQIAFEQAKNVMPIWRSGLQGRPPRRRRRRSQVLFRSATRETTPEVSNSMDKSQQVDRLPKESWREDSPSWQHQFSFLFHLASSILSRAPVKQGRSRTRKAVPCLQLPHPHRAPSQIQPSRSYSLPLATCLLPPCSRSHH